MGVADHESLTPHSAHDRSVRLVKTRIASRDLRIVAILSFLYSNYAPIFIHQRRLRLCDRDLGLIFSNYRSPWPTITSFLFVFAQRGS
jgi:hypothetical protein